MQVRCLSAEPGAAAVPADPIASAAGPAWVWIDVELSPDEASAEDLEPILGQFGLDPLALHDALAEMDYPKTDDFVDHLLVIIHGLGSGANSLRTHEIDCFCTASHLLTFRNEPSPSIDALWIQLQQSSALATGGPDELLGRLTDVVTRRVLSVVDLFENRVDELVGPALAADPTFLGDLTAVRKDMAKVRRIVHPQREVLDELRRSSSNLLSEGSRRRFSDVFDVVDRTARGLEGVRTALSETLDAYRGAEAGKATDVTRVLTIYAAIMLPLTLVVGFFGMNQKDLPTIGAEGSWQWIVAAMLAISALSIAAFVALGWVGAPFRRRAIGRGVVDATKVPVRLAESLYKTASVPLRHLPAAPTLRRARPVIDD